MAWLGFVTLLTIYWCFFDLHRFTVPALDIQNISLHLRLRHAVKHQQKNHCIYTKAVRKRLPSRAIFWRASAMA